MIDKCEFCPVRHLKDKQCPAKFIPNPMFCERVDPESPIFLESIKDSIVNLMEKFPDQANSPRITKSDLLIQDSYDFNPSGIPIFLADETLYDKFVGYEGYHPYVVMDSGESDQKYISRTNLITHIIGGVGSILFFAGFNESDSWLLNFLKHSYSVNYQIDTNLPSFDGTTNSSWGSLNESISKINYGNYDKDKKIVCLVLDKIYDESILSVIHELNLSSKFLLKLITLSEESVHDKLINNSVMIGFRNKTHNINRYADIILTNFDHVNKYHDRQIILDIEGVIKNNGNITQYLEDVMRKNSLGILDKAKNFKNALSDHIADGLSRTSDEVIKSRLDICAGCNQNDNGSCLACGCIIAVKTTWATSECPLHKWSAQNSELLQYKQGCGCGGKS